MRVLVVEDDAKIASFVVRGLKQSGYAVDHAPDGDTGLALAESTGYDAAIVDVMLPGLDGFSLVRRLRSARSQVPVLFLSAKSTVEDRVRGLESGADDYLTKPFAFSELLALRKSTGIWRRAERRRRTRLKPSRPGSITSTIAASYPVDSASPSPVSPSEAWSTAYPDCLSPRTTNDAILASSSTTRTRMG